MPIPSGLGPDRDQNGLSTAAWIFSVGGPTPPEVHLVYITSHPDSFPEVSAILAERLSSQGVPRPAAVRQARDPQVVAWLNNHPEWSGKAITCYLKSADEAMALAQAVDTWLAGRGFHGPPVLRARPFGGRSGMVFLRATAGGGSSAEPGKRPNRLAALLGDS